MIVDVIDGLSCDCIYFLTLICDQSEYLMIPDLCEQ